MSGAVNALASLRPTVHVGRAVCTRSLGSGCTVCVDACPQNALRLAGGDVPALDPAACVACGLCVVECPVGAVAGSGTPSVVRLLEAARVTASAGGDLEVRCGAAAAGSSPEDGDDAKQFGVSVSCLAGLDPEGVAAAALALAQQDRPSCLALVRGDCAGCAIGAGDAVTRFCEAGTAVAARVDASVRVVLVERAAPASAGAPSRFQSRRTRRREHGPRDPLEVSRRQLLTRWRPTGPGGESAGGDAVGEPSTSNRGASPRDLLLASAAQAPVPRPHVDPGCTGCRACVEVCPTEALGWGQWTRERILSVEPAACIGCAECVRVCPEDVVALVCDLEPGPPVPRVLHRAPRPTCGRCGDALSPGEQGTCTRCSSRRSVLDDVWRQYDR